MNQFGYFWWSSIQKYVTEWCLCYLLNLRSIVQIVIGGIFFSLTLLETNISIPHLMVIKMRRPFNTLRIPRKDFSTAPGFTIEPNMWHGLYLDGHQCGCWFRRFAIDLMARQFNGWWLAVDLMARQFKGQWLTINLMARRFNGRWSTVNFIARRFNGRWLVVDLMAGRFNDQRLVVVVHSMVNFGFCFFFLKEGFSESCLGLQSTLQYLQSLKSEQKDWLNQYPKWKFLSILSEKNLCYVF